MDVDAERDDHLAPAVEIAVADGYPAGAAKDLTYGDWDVLRRAVRARSQDRRWRQWFVVGSVRGELSGVLHVCESVVPVTPDPLVRQALAAIGPRLVDGPTRVATLGGGWAYRGGAVVRSHRHRSEDEWVLSELFRAAAAEALRRDLVPVALWVPHEQMVSAPRRWPDPPDMMRSDVLSTLHLGSAGSFDAYVGGLSKRRRQTMASDRRQFAAADLTTASVAVTADLIDRAADMVAAVKQGNGTPEVGRLTRMRLGRWLADAGSAAIAFECRRGSELLGVCFAEVLGDRLELTDVGLVDGASRHLAYRQLAFHAPVEWALAHHLRAVELGAGHPEVKLARGARQELTWHLAPPLR